MNMKKIDYYTYVYMAGLDFKQTQSFQLSSIWILKTFSMTEEAS